MVLDAVFWLAGLAAFAVGLSKGGLPAIGMLGVPLLSMVMSPVAAAVLLLPVFVVSDLFAMWLYRRSFSAVNLKRFLPAGILGVGVGWLTASVVSDRVVLLLIGLMGVTYCLNTWLRSGQQAQPKTAHRGWGWFWGTVSGFTSFIAHAGAPPFQMYVLPQKLPKAVYAGTATITFAVINAAKIVPYQWLRPYTLDGLQQTLAYLPFAIAGAFAGAWLTRRIADRVFFALVQGSLFVVSLKLIWDATLGR